MGRMILYGLLSAVTFIAKAQPDTVSTKQIRFNVTAGFITHKSMGGNGENPEFTAPEYLQKRRPTEPAVAQMWGLNNDRVTDSPLGHGPLYLRTHAWYSPIDALELYGSLAIDHRGMSWGPYNTDNIAYIPRFSAMYNSKKPLRAMPDSIRVFGKIGYFEDFRNYEGLVLYNLDLQGLSGGVQYRKLQLRATLFGDLIRGFGLGIDGMNDYQISLLGLNQRNYWKVDLKAGVQSMKGFPATGGDQNILTLSAAFYKNKKRIYSEIGYRKTDFSSGLNTALLLGFHNEMRSGKITADVRAEYRYYGGGFNYQFKNEEATHFRDVNNAAGSNFIGDMVYPLSFFGRPFSQWAVFTEYDKQWVQGATVFGSAGYEIKKNISVFTDIDFNLILAQGERAFVYPFYNTGLKLNMLTNTFLSLSLTNRTMNLDKHYTTYYLTNKPLFQLELKRGI